MLCCRYAPISYLSQDSHARAQSFEEALLEAARFVWKQQEERRQQQQQQQQDAVLQQELPGSPDHRDNRGTASEAPVQGQAQQQQQQQQQEDAMLQQELPGSPGHRDMKERASEAPFQGKAQQQQQQQQQQPPPAKLQRQQQGSKWRAESVGPLRKGAKKAAAASTAQAGAERQQASAAALGAEVAAGDELLDLPQQQQKQQELVGGGDGASKVEMGLGDCPVACRLRPKERAVEASEGRTDGSSAEEVDICKDGNTAAWPRSGQGQHARPVHRVGELLAQMRVHATKRLAELATAQLQLLMDHGTSLSAPARCSARVRARVCVLCVRMCACVHVCLDVSG